MHSEIHGYVRNHFASWQLNEEVSIKPLWKIAQTKLFLQRFVQVVQRMQQAIEYAASRAFAPHGIVQFPTHVVAPFLCQAPRFFATFATIEV